MAPRRPAPRARANRPTLVLGLVFAVAGTLAARPALAAPDYLGPAGPAGQHATATSRPADGPPGLDVQLAQAVDRYDAAVIELSGLRRRVASLQRRLAVSTAAVAAERARLQAMAVAAYQGSGQAGLAALLAAIDPASSLNQQVDLEQVSHAEAVQLAGYLAAVRRLTAQRSAAGAAVGAERRLVARLAGDRNHIQRMIAAQQAAVNALPVTERAAAVASAAAAAALPPQLPPGPGAAAAVRFAYAQLGKPYVYAAAGPNAYDCSGLTMMAWAAGGVSLPHNAAMQQAMIPPVPLADLQPGDLVFFGDPAYHVVIYIGGGDVIQAEMTGTDIMITPLSEMGTPASAGRP